MRRPVLLLLSALLFAPAFAADARLVRVWPEWHDAKAFDRIREYFGGAEDDGREIVVRSHADQRAGLYFLVRVEGVPTGTPVTFHLDIIRPDRPEPLTYTFPLVLKKPSQVAELGLTGADWPGGRSAHPVAWNISVTDAAGGVLAQEHSFLWANPSR